MAKVVVEDLVVGIIAMFHKKERAPGKEGRFHIFCKPAKVGGFAGKPFRLPGAISPKGMLEVPATSCEDGFGRIIIFSYGDDERYPPIITGAIKEKIGETIKSLERMSLEMGGKTSALEAKKRLFNRSKDEEIEKATKRKNKYNKKGSQGFLPYDRESNY